MPTSPKISAVPASEKATGKAEQQHADDADEHQAGEDFAEELLRQCRLRRSPAR